jgi:hypothetical protein
MQPAAGLSFSLLVVILLGVLLLLQIKFPNASRKSETGVLVLVTVAFFGLCSVFLRP